MKKISQRLFDNGFICRTEATITKTTYKFISHYAIEHEIKTFGEAVDALMKEAETIHFSDVFIDYQNKQIKISESAAIQLHGILKSLTEKYKKSDDAISAIKEVSDSIHSIDLIPSALGGDGKFIDCYVSEYTQIIFERISRLYKHQGSKSIVIEAMVEFIKTH